MIEKRIIRREIGVEYKKVRATCNHCAWKWEPYDHEIRLPLEAVLKCPECEQITECIWLDSKMNKEMIYKKHVLGYEPKIKNASKKIEELTKERDEWKERFQNEFDKNTMLIKSIEKITTKLQELGVEIVEDKNNPLSN